jgi:hypothetical protein
LFLAAVLGWAGLAGCVGGGEAPSGLAGGSSSASGGLGSSLPKAGSWVASPIELPLAVYFEAGNMITEAAVRSKDAAKTEWSDNVQALVAQCMKDQGFEYYPVEYVPAAPADENTAPFGAPGMLGVPPLPGSLEEVERVGYGQWSFEEWSGGYQFDSPVPDGQAANDAYAASLSDSARRAYELALDGDEDADPASKEGADGCAQRAVAAYPEPSGPGLEVLAPIADAYRALGSVLEGQPDGTFKELPVDEDYWVYTEPSFVALTGEYAECVGDLGFGGFVGRLDPFTPGVMQTMAVHTNPEGETLPVSTEELGVDDIALDQRSLVGSQAERDIAVADFKCRQQTDYVNRYAAAVAAVQQRYLDGHRAKLDAALAQIEQLAAQLDT